MQYSGVIAKVSSFDFNPTTKLWSFTLNNRQEFFRCGQKRPAVEQGQFVTFDAIPGKNGALNVETKSIVAKTVEAEATGIQVARNGATANVASKDDFWSRKEDRDVSTQIRIERQSTRNSALEFIKILLSQEAVKFTAKSDKVDVIEKLLEHYQTKFLKENAGVEVTPTPKDPVEDDLADAKVPY